MEENMKITAITTCVNMANIFQFVYPHNKDFFDRWIVATDPDDLETMSYLKRKSVDVDIYETKLFWEDGAGFDKGGVINDIILNANIDPDHWICTIDADIIADPRIFEMFNQMEGDVFDNALIYCAGRIIDSGNNQLEIYDLINSGFDETRGSRRFIKGNNKDTFFHMFKARFDYPRSIVKNWNNRILKEFERWIRIPFNTIHLGVQGKMDTLIRESHRRNSIPFNVLGTETEAAADATEGCCGQNKKTKRREFRGGK
jgi:hypothetical protein